ncbi:DNA polymerase III subunit beta [Thiocystis violascens]|uniref:Beta sliding clamp n=1 Tax=Thiocystis violascens (strain ATCC 17096 / DSM 198 / 6111) TaxID=765911 RepID=I3YCN7_THIV6|nr:DNA polymerase III subunit beta [Thiocystis violascens]AFL74755.1 DNA polymerase III, beta subunit [Thiocystis violascens DSM 198]
MEFVVNREILLPALVKVTGVVERRQTLPILSNLHLFAESGRVTMTGSDLEVEVKTDFAVETQHTGDATIPARKLIDICRSLGDGAEIRFRIGDDRCVITSGRGRFSLGVLPAADFPFMEPVNDGFQFTISESILKRLLEKTSFAMAQQDVRYYLNGLLIEFNATSLTAVATDGHRLAKYRSKVAIGISEPRQVIIPSKTILELRRQLSSSEEDATMSLGEKSFHISFGNMAMTSKIVDGRYPEYERVIPRELQKSALLKKDELKRSLSRTAILSNEKYRGVRLTFLQDTLKLLAHNPEQEEAEEEIELLYTDESTSIGFNVSYLMDVLGAIDESDVHIQFQDGNSSSVWRGKDAEDETFVVMPMRI